MISGVLTLKTGCSRVEITRSCSKTNWSQEEEGPVVKEYQLPEYLQ
jgi:hypothetical protein